MPKYSRTSQNNLSTADDKLQLIFNEVIKHYDCSVLYGFRNEELQNKAYNEKKSKLKWPDSKHNSFPSKAVDVAPYYTDDKIPWKDRERFSLFAGFVLGVASQFGVKIRWGGDWNNNKKTKDEKFWDAAHFELID